MFAAMLFTYCFIYKPNTYENKILYETLFIQFVGLVYQLVQER